MKSQICKGYLIHPMQELSREKEPNPPFVIDKQFYQTDTTYPESLYAIHYDWLRGCKVAIVQVHTARYNPFQKKLTYFMNWR